MNNNTTHTEGGLAQGRPIMLELLQKGGIETSDVARMRRQMFDDRSLSRIEVEDLFSLDSVLRPTCEAWTEFFVEAVTDHVIWDLRPTGVLGDDQAHWLLGKIDAALTASSFAILVNILDEAHRVPRWFEGAVRSRAVTAWSFLMMSQAPCANAHH